MKLSVTEPLFLSFPAETGSGALPADAAGPETLGRSSVPALRPPQRADRKWTNQSLQPSSQIPRDLGTQLKNSTIHLRRVGAALAFLFAAATAWAQAQVATELVAEKLVRQASGKESFVKADDVKPGDVVVYTATYKNTGTAVAHALVATVPVPPGMDWQGAAGEKLAPSQASLDGITFSAIPLTRKVKVADKELQQAVPLNQYRYLRWSLPDLSAGANVSVKVTAKVATNP